MGWSLQVENPPAFEGNPQTGVKRGRIFGDFILPPNRNIVETLQTNSPWLGATEMVAFCLPPTVRLWGLVTLGQHPVGQAEDVAGCAGSLGTRSIPPPGLSWG